MTAPESFNDIFEQSSGLLKISRCFQRIRELNPQASVFSVEANRFRVELHIEPSSLVIRSRAREVGEAKVEVPVAYDGAPQTVGFNPVYLQDALKVMEPGSEIRFEFTNAKSPGKLSDCDEYTYVVMPIALE